MAKRVLIITPVIKPGGGPPGYVYNLKTGIDELSSKGLLKNHFEFLGEISEQRNKATGEKFKSKNFGIFSIIIYLITLLGLKPVFSRKIKFAKQRISNADLVIIQGFQDVYLAKYMLKSNVPFAYMPHSPSIMAEEYKMLCELNGQFFSLDKYERYKKDESFFLKFSKFVVFPSEGARSEYDIHFIEELSNKKVIYIKSGVNVSFNIDKNKKAKKDSKKVEILYVGRYISHKGYDLFCDAAELISKEDNNIIFKTVGDGPMKRKSDKIIDLGWRNDVFEVINQCDIIVVPNRIAYYDLLPIECAALGKPLVMTSVGGNIDQLKEFPDSVFCNKLCSVALQQAINEAILKFKTSDNWGLENFKKYELGFTAKSFARRWDCALEG
ncbi:MAG: glycosyltransferase family 4 protein [Algoriphagus aquaeductus]|uniref:glycosyltransferase family 4 protein n=1 Tax=Algoriphagus aquaeductus TaxID=475299 RepID=UPI00387A4BB7